LPITLSDLEDHFR